MLPRFRLFFVDDASEEHVECITLFHLWDTVDDIIHTKYGDNAGIFVSQLYYANILLNPEGVKDFLLSDIFDTRVPFHTIHVFKVRPVLPPGFQIQSADEYDFDDTVMNQQWKTMFHYVNKALNAMPKFEGGSVEQILDVFENVYFSIHYLSRAKSINEFWTAVMVSSKLFHKRNALTSVRMNFTFMKKLYEEHLQVGPDNVEEVLRACRTVLDGADNVMKIPMVKRLHKLFYHLLVRNFFSNFGITMDSYEDIEIAALKLKYKDDKKFLHVLLDTVLFTIERAYQFKKTGNWSVFVHSGSTYLEWYDGVEKLIVQSNFTGDPESVGFKYHEYIQDLEDYLEKGEAISKNLRVCHSTESRYFDSKLAQLRMIKSIELTRKAAQATRKAPFGVLVFGGSSVGKSGFQDILFNYYGKLFGLKTDDCFRYVRNPVDDYWVGFTSSKWCVQMDDIAFLEPDKAPAGDPSVLEMLQVVNNVPFMPPQAALEDKGRTPMRPRLVLASTNKMDINAMAYFQTPFAVQRRLPYVISIEPKPEYAKDGMLDPTKIPQTTDIPDLWIITVYSVKPVTVARKSVGDYEVKKYVDADGIEKQMVFSDIHEFLKVFGQTARDFEKIQCQAHISSQVVKCMSVCSNCLMVDDRCRCASEAIPHLETVQSGDTVIGGDTILPSMVVWSIPQANYVPNTITFWCVLVILWILSFKDGYLIRSSYMRDNAARFVANRLYPIAPRESMQFLGKLSEVVRDRKFQAFVAFFGIVGGAILLASTKFGKNDSKESCEIQSDNIHEERKKKLSRDEKPNVWYNPQYYCSPLDLPQPSMSYSGDIDSFCNMLIGNLFEAKIGRYSGDRRVTRTNKVVGVGGFIYMTNNHAFPEDAEEYNITLVGKSDGASIAPISFTLKEPDLIRNRVKDLVFFKFRGRPPCKNIVKYFDTGKLAGVQKGKLISITGGELDSREITALTGYPTLPVELEDFSSAVWGGRTQHPTVVGSCGSLLVIDHPRGPILAGIHIVGGANAVYAIKVSQKDIENGENSLRIPPTPKIQSEDLEVDIGPLHPKSVFRYIPNANVTVYGSFKTFWRPGKSRVGRTILSNEFEELYGKKAEYGRPKLHGWEPWFQNIEPMVKPHLDIDYDILESCKEGYLKDVFGEFEDKGGPDQLFVLSDIEAVNGIPGVQYIDRLNINSSMGFPWNTSKKNHIIETPSEQYPHGIDFSDEVWQRVREIEVKYKSGHTVAPIFTMHLKDEVLPQAKIDKGKTRAFTGSPVDWSIVVRKYLLSFVRLVQRNKDLFEAYPGLVCQSHEWTQLYKRLTQFGADQMVAGDYSKFDKKMVAPFILAAYDIIIEIHRHAGWEEPLLKVLEGIGIDTAFPTVKVQNDLVQFYGTNPSGHPLTVIINCIVNSLYMRYAYMILNPKGEVESFRDNVALATYGDDNVLGVSRQAPWFNHSTIQSALCTIGVEYTMADKETESRPYIHMDKVVFLKRSFVFDEEVGAYLAPLDEDSIFKSLTWWVASKSICPEAQMSAILVSAIREYFFYGRERYNEMSNAILQISENLVLSGFLNREQILSWEDLLAQFNNPHPGGSHVDDLINDNHFEEPDVDGPLLDGPISPNS